MKRFVMILVFGFVAPAMAAETDARPYAERTVADDIEIKTLPTGEVVTRLVSRNRVTARQFWVDSVYGPYRSIVVFQGKGEPAQMPAIAQSSSAGDWRISRNYPVLDVVPALQQPIHASREDDKRRDHVMETAE